VLQEREFERVGGNRTIKVDVRILATSNRDLLRNVEQGQFRQDLYYRLNVFPVAVPPLRERVEDIVPLAEHFLSVFVRKHGISVTGFGDSALRAIKVYRWPGNVRELQNTIERAVILSQGGRSVSAAALGLPTSAIHQTEIDWSGQSDSRDPDGETGGDGAAQPDDANGAVGPVAVTSPDGCVLSIAKLERQAIEAALAQTEGNRAHACSLLGISIRTLRNKLQEYKEADANRALERTSG
jgi:DNA-binding NtrC family response regulator